MAGVTGLDRHLRVVWMPQEGHILRRRLIQSERCRDQGGRPMRKRFQLFIALLTCMIIGDVRVLFANGDPSEVNIKLYKLWVGEKADCSDMVEVYSNDNPSYRDMMQGPTFGAVTIPNGTYRCIALKLNDQIHGKSNYDSANCDIGQNVDLDIFRAPDVSTCPDGSTVNAGAPGSEDRPCVYFSTTGAAINGPWD